MSMEQLILYDNPSRFGTGTTWSPNVWKTRLLLNFKGIDYKTEWVHGPDIAPTFQSFGLSAHIPGTELADYTVPAVRLPDGSYVMESLSIAKKLEALQPTPNAYVDHPVVEEVARSRKRLLMCLAPVLVPRMPRECLSGPTIRFHEKAREKTYGMTLEMLEDRFGGRAAWTKAQPLLDDLAGILKRQDGPFCLGQTPSYADFIIVAFLEWCRCLQGGIFERIVGNEKSYHDLYMACRPWLQRNDH
ncbi:hypothetical protein V8C42DRAFT_358770 [Trichoderma barbatum]